MLLELRTLSFNLPKCYSGILTYRKVMVVQVTRVGGLSDDGAGDGHVDA